MRKHMAEILDRQSRCAERVLAALTPDDPTPPRFWALLAGTLAIRRALGDPKAYSELQAVLRSYQQALEIREERRMGLR